MTDSKKNRSIHFKSPAKCGMMMGRDTGMMTDLGRDFNLYTVRKEGSLLFLFIYSVRPVTENVV